MLNRLASPSGARRGRGGGRSAPMRSYMPSVARAAEALPVDASVEVWLSLSPEADGKFVRSAREPVCMGARFIGCDREQVFLMPPSLRDWVPEEHLVWTVLEAVDELGLSAIYADYRDDGRGRPAYEPSMMVALLLYAYARGNRSSCGIERACV